MSLFSPEIVGIICNEILATIEKALSIKFPFIPDLGILRDRVLLCKVVITSTHALPHIPKGFLSVKLLHLSTFRLI